MLKRRGIFAVIAVLFIFAILHVTGAKEAHDTRIVGSTLLGGFAFLLMTSSIWLSTRPRFAESFFGGLDRMYQIHKFCGIFAGLLVLAHFASVPDKLSHFDAAQRGDFFPSVPLGITAFVTLILSLALALNRKISYSKWRNPHKAMGLVYILAIGHFVTAPVVFFDKFGPSGYMLMAAACIGVISLAYSLFGMNRKTALTYKIDTVNRLERATELVLSPLDKSITFKPGQFAFVEVQGKGWQEPHPFTISSAPNDKDLRFTMKELGDWTRKVRDELEPGLKVLVRGPYGRFDTAVSDAEQIWVAGGIGITPFLSMIRDMPDNDPRKITLYYGVREEAEALFLDEIKQRAAELPNFTLKMLQSNHGEFVTIDGITQDCGRDFSKHQFFFCGPTPMIKQLRKDLKPHNVNRSQIHTEAFEFR